MRINSSGSSDNSGSKTQGDSTSASLTNRTVGTYGIDAVTGESSSCSYGAIDIDNGSNSGNNKNAAIRTRDSIHIQNQNQNSAAILQSYRIRPRKEGQQHQPKTEGDGEGYEKDDSDNDDDDDDDDDVFFYFAKERLLDQSKHFDLDHAPDRGYRATEYTFSLWNGRGFGKRPHMRAFHASWICFFVSGMCQFAMAPIMPSLQQSLTLSKSDVWWTHVGMMLGGIPMRFLLGPLCDRYGPRLVMVWIVVLCAIPCALSGLIVVNFTTLLGVRFLLGAMDAFVPCQCWITSHFVREVGGTLMAVAGGLGASGAGFTQLIVGSLYAVYLQWTGGDDDLSWKLALVMPAIFAMAAAGWAFVASDDCPLGNFGDVKKAGLMMERSAVDSFRSGVYNINAWLLFLQFAGSCGVDFTMCNGCALYFHYQFGQSIPTSGVLAFAYGFAAIYARGVGGYISDRLGDVFQLQGRLWFHMLIMIVQGFLNICFARTTEDLQQSAILMIIFSIFVQMSMGTCYGIVPFVDSINTGSIAGIVGAGGNVGAAILGFFFIHHPYDKAMEYMGWFTISLGLMTPLIVIKGYKGIVFGKDNLHDPSRHQHSPLLVPKLHQSPHLVKLRHKQRRNIHTSDRLSHSGAQLHRLVPPPMTKTTTTTTVK